MPSPLPFRIFNSFTTTPFSGNPGAVYVFPQDERGSDNATLMLNIAREHNLSETGFLVPRPADGDSVVTYGLRWFTPTVEFPLCGHVTLGSAHVLFAEHHPDAEKLRFETMSGTLFATRLDDGRIELDFPADVSVVEEVDELLEEDLLDKLVLVNASLAANVVRIKKGKIAWIVEVKEDFDLETAALTVAPLARSPPLSSLPSILLTTSPEHSETLTATSSSPNPAVSSIRATTSTRASLIRSSRTRRIRLYVSCSSPSLPFPSSSSPFPSFASSQSSLRY